MEIISNQYFAERFPARKRDAHKGNFGKILIFAGSTGMAGAAVLCGRAALRSGAGLVRFLLPSCDDKIYPILQTAVPAATCTIPEQIPDFNEFDAIAAGSGLGSGPERSGLLRAILEHYRGKLLLDADALNAVAHDPVIKKAAEQTAAELIFTPHIGEAKRLLGTDAPIQTEKERLAAAGTLAEAYHAVILLKGSGTLICAPDQKTLKNESGNPGMATGGSGDVLSGIIAAFAGQGLSAFEAAACGALVHGRAGDLAAERLGEVCMNAEDIIAFLPEAFRLCLK